jgi:hypothetical protein
LRTDGKKSDVAFLRSSQKSANAVGARCHDSLNAVERNLRPIAETNFQERCDHRHMTTAVKARGRFFRIFDRPRDKYSH